MVVLTSKTMFPLLILLLNLKTHVCWLESKTNLNSNLSRTNGASYSTTLKFDVSGSSTPQKPLSDPKHDPLILRGLALGKLGKHIVIEKNNLNYAYLFN